MENQEQEGKASTVFETEQFKKALMKHVKDHGGTAMVGGQDFVQALVKSALEALLQVEMEEQLGYAKNSLEPKASDNRRNGTSTKKVRGDFGQVDIEVPRDRNGEFEPEIVRKREADIGMFSEKIISLYTRGMTTREIEEHLREMYGIDASPSFISRATERMEQDVVEWQNRPLQPLYPVVFFDGMRVPVRSGDGGKGSQVLKKVVYTVLGVTTAGIQEVLGLWIAETESASFWLQVCNDVKARGVRDILIACGDGLTGLPDAIRAVFPDVDVQGCVVHQIRNVTKYVPWKDRKEFCRDMREIYSAPTIEAAELALERLDAKWSSKYPAAIYSWRRNWDVLTAYFKYPLELRRVVYTTNAIEALHALLRKNTSNRKVFPNDASVIRLLYLNVKNYTNRWTKRHGWDTLMNQLSIMHSERIARAMADDGWA